MSDEPSPELVDAVERVLISLLIDKGYLKSKNFTPQEFRNAHESWMADVRTEREDKENG